MEFTAVMLNINLGHNEKIMKQCRQLEEYAIFIDEIRIYQQKGYKIEEAVDAASEYCIAHNVLRDFLLKNRNEVRKLILTEYDEKKHMNIVRENAKEEGRIKERATITRKLIEKKIPISEIFEITGLTDEEIRKLM